MARTAQQIQQSLADSITATNPRIDVAKGPVYDTLLQPVPIELAITEAEQDRLNTLVTLQFGDVATPEEATAISTAFSVAPGLGGPSLCTVTYKAYALPSQDLPVERGSLVSTLDNQYIYITTERQVLPALQASLYYNATTKAYELTVNIEAQAVGPDYDVAAYSIRNMMTPVQGFDAVENRIPASGGVLAEDPTTTLNRVQAALAGTTPDSAGGVASDVRDFDTANVGDVAIVFSKDRTLFTRPINRPAMDAYVIGLISTATTQSFTAVGGEQAIVLTSVPVLSVDAVTVNGTPVGYAFVSDTSTDYGGSASAGDFVMLDAPVLAHDVVFVSYSYNSLIASLQSQLFNNLDRPFATNVLARQSRKVLVQIVLDVAVLPSFDLTRTSNALQGAIYAIVQPGQFVDELSPSDFRDTLKAQVGGLSSINVNTFRRASGSMQDVEVIDFAKNEESQVDVAFLTINVHR
jgi:hypothetical protein